jgi:hypothetical protein
MSEGAATASLLNYRGTPKPVAKAIEFRDADRCDGVAAFLHDTPQPNILFSQSFKLPPSLSEEPSMQRLSATPYSPPSTATVQIQSLSSAGNFERSFWKFDSVIRFIRKSKPPVTCC